MSENKANQLEKDYGIELVDSSEIQLKKKYDNYKYKKLAFHERILTFRFWKYIIFIFLWLISLKLIEKYTGFGSMFLIASILVLIFTNLSHKERKEGELSAYSIFNEGAKRILGDNPEQFMAQFGINRNRDDQNGEEEIKKNKKVVDLQIPKDSKEWMKQISKMGNKPCYCGSDKKYKKCCYYRELRQQQESQDYKKRQQDQQYKEAIYSDED
ncbi:SEC-C motif protein (macronuclear) [Tetrahymena thermophila SB210]|uniref:SEC-C motif protein n=1 Tax=Tetrahymena thermophila (strain SB210) TaxID=312017 RepID=Q24D70_TETTS|nr:SEC-C motif protein [Tetrahymena thermophila SB210]EAS05719.1 SEC-C motif protein [Tetrahymena thermophila SB210]|eukprot:XP_001025964.1 SEC-C motif protein [Tetrahymena thermophila SB210]